MASPAPHRPAELPAAAREAVTAIEADPAAPAKVLVTGGIGTGKSTVLAAVRAALRSAGRPVLSRPRRPDDPAEAAVVAVGGWSPWSVGWWSSWSWWAESSWWSA
ncbi:hypothetical protein, partial [Mycolicibacterium monacense]|uniref:hypothetical protein n=1 Tax=Mycolicibacterium monacense TaxID=85693 RepID=UPI001F1950C9